MIKSEKAGVDNSTEYMRQDRRDRNERRKVPGQNKEDRKNRTGYKMII
jgi:hypothetical protein